MIFKQLPKEVVDYYLHLRTFSCDITDVNALHQIPGYEGYYITPAAVCFKQKNNGNITPHASKKNMYNTAYITLNSSYLRVDNVMLLTFIKTDIEDFVPYHLNGDMDDNSIINLIAIPRQLYHKRTRKAFIKSMVWKRLIPKIKQEIIFKSEEEKETERLFRKIKYDLLTETDLKLIEFPKRNKLITPFQLRGEYKGEDVRLFVIRQFNKFCKKMKCSLNPQQPEINQKTILGFRTYFFEAYPELKNEKYSVENLWDKFRN